MELVQSDHRYAIAHPTGSVAATGWQRTVASLSLPLVPAKPWPPPCQRLIACALAKWAAGAVRLIYLSPLKALGSDVQRNLIAPLETLLEAHSSANSHSDADAETGREHAISVGIRTGDTSPNERERQLRRPRRDPGYHARKPAVAGDQQALAKPAWWRASRRDG